MTTLTAQTLHDTTHVIMLPLLSPLREAKVC